MTDWPGLTPEEIRRTGEAVAAMQRPDGRLPWHTDQHTDAWNHVEGAMGLALAGQRAAAERAYDWLVGAQRADGSWAEKYDWDGRIENPDADTNMCAYIAVGVWHHYLLTDDQGFLHDFWPVVERAIDYVLDVQAPGGEIGWMRHSDGSIDRRALLTACSSIHMSLRCAVAAAEALGEERPDWELSVGMVAHAIRYREEEAFWPKPRWSMDWYYPILGGAVRGEDAILRLNAQWDRWVVDGRGCRCVVDQPWVTTAETCELVLALDAVGDEETARRLFTDVQFLRQEDGSYQEGWVFPEGAHWPGRTPPWTAGAVLLANDALTQTSPAWDLFRGDRLPTGIHPDDAFEDDPVGPQLRPRSR